MALASMALASMAHSSARASTRVPLLTVAEVEGRPLFRMVQLEVETAPGQGRVWLDLSRGCGADMDWQRHLHHLAAQGQARYALGWRESDLYLSARGRKVSLGGWSASLPLFVAWVALLAGRALPEPFFATGVCSEGGEALVPAPLALLQGKLEVVEAYARQALPESCRPVVWVPAGSEYDSSQLPALMVREVASLTEAVSSILGEVPRRPAGSGAEGGPQP